MVVWYEGTKRCEAETYPSGIFKYVGGVFTRTSKKDPKWDGRVKEQPKHEYTKSGLQIITDAIEVKSFADGKMYSSKHKYYESVKQSGNHVLEAGENYNRKPGEQPRGDYSMKKELKQAIQQHLGG